MALDPGTILCMTQYNKTDIYTLLGDGTQYRLVSLRYDQGSPEPSLRSIASASKLSLGEIRRPLDCYGRSSDAAFIAVMPGTRATYTDPTLRGLRVDFDKNSTDPIWSAAEVNLIQTA
ncbi:hypothetical protein BGZ81_009163 [Podila clonocystis]|nr:hypothetical protein BGZ81_009163 [Podila clonocystis]